MNYFGFILILFDLIVDFCIWTNYKWFFLLQKMMETLSIYLSTNLFICFFIHLSICPSIHISDKMSFMLLRTFRNFLFVEIFMKNCKKVLIKLKKEIPPTSRYHSKLKVIPFCWIYFSWCCVRSFIKTEKSIS